MNPRLLMYGSALALAMSMLTTPALAGLVYSDTSVSMYLNDGFPDEDEQQIFLDKTPNGTLDSLATGNVGSQNGTPEALFQSNTNIIAANGFANIKGTEGDYGQLDVLLEAGYAFTDLKFDVQLATTKVGQTVTNIADELRVYAFFEGGSSVSYSEWLTDDDWKNGLKADNTLMVVAEPGQFLTSILIQTYSQGQLVAGLFETKHFEVSGVCTLGDTEEDCGGDGGGGGNPVPLPGALPLMMSGIAGLGYLARRRKLKIH